jgi:ABC-2 type transport system permease protein
MGRRGAGGGGGAKALLRKELRELALSEGRPVVQVLIAAAMDLLLGIGAPIAVANALHASLGTWGTVGVLCAVVVAVGAFMGFIGPMPTIADAFAGERERHTLETLLASPASDRAILLGKMGAQYTLVLAHVVLVSVAAGLTSAALLGPPGLLVTVAGLAGGSVAAFLTASFIIGLGTLLSLRAPTVKKAQEWISYTVLPVFFVPGLLPMLVRNGFLRGQSAAQVTLVLALPLVLAVGSIAFNVLAFRGFRRDRLIGRS